MEGKSGHYVRANIIRSFPVLEHVKLLNVAKIDNFDRAVTRLNDIKGHTLVVDGSR
jgi:hypothetical protein